MFALWFGPLSHQDYLNCFRGDAVYALSVIIVTNDETQLLDGSLIKLPVELQSKYQMDWYAKQAAPGWTKCPQGYYVFTAIDHNGVRYVFPGLNLEQEKRPAKKFYTVPHFFTKERILQFAESVLGESERLQRAKDEDVRDLIHDLRALSSAIYNSAIAARDGVTHRACGCCPR